MKNQYEIIIAESFFIRGKTFHYEKKNKMTKKKGSRDREKPYVTFLYNKLGNKLLEQEGKS